MRVVGIIPARLASTRLPRKLLLDATGKPLIQYTWEAAMSSELLDDVIIAADSQEIANVVTGFGGRCELTGDHPSGTDRIAEVVKRVCPDVDAVVNIQGDEPEIESNHISQLVDSLIQSGSEMATLATPITRRQELDDPSCVKVVCGQDGRALYFSRATIPFSHSPWKLHLGLYAYKTDFLLRLTQLPPSPLEKLEKLEQLRALEAGGRVQLAIVEHRSVGIDTPEDYAAFVARQMQAPISDTSSFKRAG
ncbi:UNVERIFIED_CONTAM: hypothetical protein GTU68_049198 [Idotea baltica]|nr:hypothetical protein [Idotea baltica]